MAVGLCPNSLIIRGSWFTSLAHYAQAAHDCYTSKIPVRQAAGLIASLAVSDLRGIVNIGGPRRSIYEIASDDSPHVQAVCRAEIVAPYQLPADTSLDLSRMQYFLEGQL
jgi:hypothetical protein